MTEFVGYWPEKYTENPPTCAEVYEDISNYISSVKGIDKDNIRIMYYHGEMPNYKYKVILKDLPKSNLPAIGYVTWRGDFNTKQYCFWWAKADRNDEYVYIGTK